MVITKEAKTLWKDEREKSLAYDAKKRKGWDRRNPQLRIGASLEKAKAKDQ